MTYEEYNRAEQENLAGLVATLILLLRPYLGVPLNDVQWLTILRAIYPQVEQARQQSSYLARRFYDSERRRVLSSQVVDVDTFRQINDLSRHPIYLAEYRLEWFVEAMEPVRERFISETATDSTLGVFVGIAAKEVQNGGRRTQIRATKTDERVEGWARVAGGNESCAFCTMLISRGPVYKDATNAGLNVESNTQAVEIWRQYNRSGNDDLLLSLMTRWHENCDCRVVPVFDKSNWPGRDEYLEAERLWASTTGGYTGRDKLNAFRRALGDGYEEGSSPSRAA